MNSELLASLSKSEKQALRQIWTDGASTRGALALGLGVSKMQATTLSRSLAEKGFVEEEAIRDGSRGQPTRSITLLPDAAYSVGVNIWRSSLEAGVLDASGKLRALVRIPFSDFSVDTIAKLVQRYLKKELPRAGVSREKVCGIGIALPGYRASDSTMTQAYFPSWDRKNLGEEFQTHFELPVVVERNSLCAAWGERLLGVCSRIDNYLFVHISYGVGGGVVLNGKLIRGQNGNAGVLGVPFPVGTPRPSGQDLLDTMNSNGLQVDDLHDLDRYDVLEHDCMNQWFDRAAQQLQQPLNIFAGVLDPEAIVIGGRLPQKMVQTLVDRISGDGFCRTTREFLPVPALIPSELCDTGGVAGAAALALSEALFPT